MNFLSIKANLNKFWTEYALVTGIYRKMDDLLFSPSSDVFVVWYNKIFVLFIKIVHIHIDTWKRDRFLHRTVFTHDGDVSWIKIGCPLCIFVSSWHVVDIDDRSLVLLYSKLSLSLNVGLYVWKTGQRT